MSNILQVPDLTKFFIILYIIHSGQHRNKNVKHTEYFRMRNNVAGILNDEHIADLRLREPSRQHTRVHTREEDCRGLKYAKIGHRQEVSTTNRRIIPDPFELLDQLLPYSRPVGQHSANNLLQAGHFCQL